MKDKVTKTKMDLINEVSEATGFPKNETYKIVNAFIDSLVKTIGEHNRVEIRGFGVFRVKERKGRNAVNPRTKQPMNIPDHFAPTFKPSKSLKDSVKR